MSSGGSTSVRARRRKECMRRTRAPQPGQSPRQQTRAQRAALEVTILKDCLGGERIVEVQLPRGLRREDLERLDGVERCEVLSGLPRPFVRVDVPGMFLLTGILEDARVRFTVRRGVRERARELATTAAQRMVGGE